MLNLFRGIATLTVTFLATVVVAQEIETLNNESIKKSKDLAPITVNEHFEALPEPVDDIGLTFSERREPRSELGKRAKSLQEGGGGFRVIDIKGPVAPAVSTKRTLERGPVNKRRGTIRVVEFWATWCGPCKQTIPMLTQVQKKFAGHNVQVIGISSEDDEKIVDAFVKQMGGTMNYTVGHDPDGRTSNAYSRIWKVNTIPHAYLVSHDNRVLWHGHPGNVGILEAAIREAIQYRDTSK